MGNVCRKKDVKQIKENIETKKENEEENKKVEQLQLKSNMQSLLIKNEETITSYEDIKKVYRFDR